MRNRLFWGLLVSVAVIVAVLVWAAVGSSGVGGSNPAGTIFTIVFLSIAILAWEFLMKPGYGRRIRGTEGEAAAEPEDEPPSGGAP